MVFAHVLQSEAWRLSEGVLVGFYRFWPASKISICITHSATICCLSRVIQGCFLVRKWVYFRRWFNLPRFFFFLKVRGCPTHQTGVCGVSWIIYKPMNKFAVTLVPESFSPITPLLSFCQLDVQAYPFHFFVLTSNTVVMITHCAHK